MATALTRPSSPLPLTHSLNKRMQAAVLYGKEDVRLEVVPVPAIGRGELLVRVRTALTCGTDVKVFRRKLLLARRSGCRSKFRSLR